MWDNGDIVRAGDFIFFFEKGNENHELGTGFFCKPVKRVGFVSDAMSFIVWRGC